MTNEWGTIQRKRAGLAICTFGMWQVLDRLKTTKQQDWPFIPLDEHGRTINALVRRDWIVASPGKDGTRYKITGRGEKAHEIYSTPSEEYDDRHFDGLCPDCRERPKYNTPNGTPYGYCKPCAQLRRARNSKPNKKPGICPLCKKRPKHVTTSGNVRSYCKPCRREREKGVRKRYNADLLRRIREEGYVKYCSSCHENPVHIFGKTVTDYCYDCFRQYRKRYYHRTHNPDIYNPETHS